MIKTLFKKQMMETFSWLYRNRKTGKNRTVGGAVAFGLLYLGIFAILGFVFYGMAEILCQPLVDVGLGWLFFAIMGLIAVAMGVFGSVFNTYASLYLAKDNDLLLSMPIPPSKILAARLSGVYAIGLMYELIIMIPTVIVWFLRYPAEGWTVLFTLLIPLVLSLVVLTLSCVLGWLVAAISTRLRNKSAVTVVLSLAFLAGYYYVYGNAYSMLEKILSDPLGAGETAKRVLYPLYQMGLAAEGKPLSMLIFTAITAALFLLVYLVLQRSFIGIATANRGTSKPKYREKATKAGSPDSALLRKELRRFTGSPTYMLNCGLGIVMMLIAAVVLLIYRDTVSEILALIPGGFGEVLYLMAVGAVCMMVSMNDISAPSVSLEGKNIWLVQVYPVSGWQALKAKLKLHLVLTLIPGLLLTAAVEYVIRPTLWFVLLIPAVTVLYILLTALIGLLVNLKIPNLNWTSEIVPIKQGIGVMAVLLGGWALVAAMGGLYYALRSILSPLAYLGAVAALLLLADALLLRWLKTRGTEIFETL